MKASLKIGCALLLLALFSARGANSVQLGWCPSPSAGVAGYHVYYGIGAITNWTPDVVRYLDTNNPCAGKVLLQAGQNWFRAYTNTLDVGNVTQCTVSNLLPGVTYYFTVEAYSSYGDVAPYSNEVAYNSPANTTKPLPPVNLRRKSNT